MNLRMYKGMNIFEIAGSKWDIVLHGDAIDDRGYSVLETIPARSLSMKKMNYRPDELAVDIERDLVSVDGFADMLRPYVNSRVLLEATTLGLAEIVLCCNALQELNHNAFDILYVEPEDYRRQERSDLLRRRDFELSNKVPGYRAIPGSALLLGDRKPFRSVFFLGYEEARLRRAFEDLQMIKPSNTSIAFGVPAYRAGWEMDAMANNISVIAEQNIRGGVYFCGADNPYAVLEVLREIYRGLDSDERLVLAPIGTKPHGIGVALFAATHENVGIIYDHPQRTRKRSSHVGHWHLFAIEKYQVST